MKAGPTISQSPSIPSLSPWPWKSQIDSLRDEVVDLVALRARLEARMKARLDGEDWNGLDETLKDFAKLTPRRSLRQAPHRSSRRTRRISRQSSRQAVLTKTAQASDQPTFNR